MKNQTVIIVITVLLSFINFSCEEYHESTATNDNQTENFIDTNESPLKSTGGIIIDEREIRKGTEPLYTLEVDGAVPGGYVLTGIGARADGTITTLHLQGRYLNEDGTLGPRYTWKFGSAPNHELEFWYAVPDNAVIYGLGFRMYSGNITTARIYYRYLDGTRLSGAMYTQNTGSDPSHTLEVEYIPEENEEDMDRVIITGVGMREDQGDMTTLKIMAGYIE